MRESCFLAVIHAVFKNLAEASHGFFMGATHEVRGVKEEGEFSNE